VSLADATEQNSNNAYNETFIHSSSVSDVGINKLETSLYGMV